jgi:cell division septum initiation protein DivIVA
MSRDFDNNMKKIIDSNKELNKENDKFQKELADIKKMVKGLDTRLISLEDKIDQIFEIMNTLTVMIYEEGEDLEDEVENEDWTPYDEHNWQNDEDEEDDDSNYPGNFSDN